MARPRWPRSRTKATSNTPTPWRSGLEEKTAADLTERGVGFSYEEETLSYEVPASNHKYTPDFVLLNGITIETKGYFEPKDRAKHLHVRESNPDRDIRFLFSRASNPIRKGSKTTYADWCEKNGFQWCEKRIPDSWIDEVGTDA